MARLKFSASSTAGIEFDPTGKATQIHWDSSFGARTGGSFGLRVFRSGRRSWILRAIVLGQQKFIVVGDADKMSLDHARAIGPVSSRASSLQRLGGIKHRFMNQVEYHGNIAPRRARMSWYRTRLTRVQGTNAASRARTTDDQFRLRSPALAEFGVLEYE